ncbi:MAG TPA: hypothetical protein VJR04_15225 [Terriglobales bacterium]|nr:hypothetical protein [Terriglobales bacterium]
MKSCRILPSLLLLGALLLGASALPATTATFSVPFRINPSTRTIQIACEIESQPGKVLRCTIDTGAQGSVGGSTAVSGASLLLAKFVTMLTPGGSQLARETEQVLIVGDTKIPILLEVIANPERQADRPVERRPTCFITEPQLICRSQLFHQLPNRFHSIRYDALRSHLSTLLGNSYGNCLGMDIQTNKFYSLHDRLLRLWLCTAFLPIRSITHDRES